MKLIVDLKDQESISNAIKLLQGLKENDVDRSGWVHCQSAGKPSATRGK